MAQTSAPSASKDNLPHWDLSDFYSGLDDPKIHNDIAAMNEKIATFSTFEGKVKERLEHLYDDLMMYESIIKSFSKLSSFAYLHYVTQMTNEKAQAFLQKIHELDAALSTRIMFFSLEIIALDEKDIEKAYAANSKLITYKRWFERTRVYKDHILDLKQEQILTQKELTSSAAWVRLYDQTLAELSFKDKNDTALNLPQLLERMSDPKPEIRKEAAELLSQELASKKSLFTLIFNTLLKDKDISDELRHYKAPWSGRHMANDIEEEVVDALVETVKANYDLCHRYYAWKAKQMGVDKIEYWDRNAPLPTAEEKGITWEEAKATVFDAYNAFSPTIAEIGKKFFDNAWIDVPAYNGKTSGAFAHPTTPDVHPYLMLNFVGKRRDVMTLAHELGHGVHQYLANEQPYLLIGTPLTVAETASVFGEMLTFRSMLSKCTSKDEKRSMLAGKIEDMLNTVFRQIAFHTFEVAMHTKRKESELSYDDLGALWQETQSAALGDAVKIDPLVHNFWGYISHFMHAPFYVYAYAFGDCLVNSLYSVYESGKVDHFQEKYIELLRAGGSKKYDELLQPFHLDPKDKSFWQGGLNVLKGLIEDLEAL